MNNDYKSDVIIIGGGLAGIVTAIELLDHGKSVIILERDKQEKFGGLAKEAFGGIMIVDTPHQRRMKINDSPELALRDWHSVANFGQSDIWPKKWAELYVNRSKELIWDYLTTKGVSFLPLVNWVERGIFQPGNTLPRWHVAWGTGYGIIAALLERLENHPNQNQLTIRFEHQVNRLITQNGKVTGCGGLLEGTDREFCAHAGIVVVTAGGMCGGDLTKIKQNWFKEWGPAPDNMLNGSHRYADGLMHDVVAGIGGNVTHLDKQWNYAAGIHHPNPNKKYHGLSVIPPRSALWMDATGKRIGPQPLVAYTNTRYMVEQICKQPGKYSWQILNWKIAIKELVISGSEYMTAFRDKKKWQIAKNLLFGNKNLINRLLNECGKDIVTARSVKELAVKMNDLGNPIPVDADLLEREIKVYDDQIDRGVKYYTDDQLRRNLISRNYKADRLRICKSQKIVDETAMPLIAIREFILSRKSLGGIQTDLECRVLDKSGEPVPNLYAAGEAAGYGGGGMHGSGALEGCFLGGCLISGQLAGREIPKTI